MNDRRRNTRAGGAIFALCIAAGMIGGVYLGQPSAGVVAGGGLGLALLLAIWLFDRRP